MKATIEIPDELYRQVKAKSALQGRAIREVTIELYQAWVTEHPVHTEPPSPERWLEEWLLLGEETLRNAPPKPTATEILDQDRNRLERR
jgi:hypothetical protein